MGSDKNLLFAITQTHRSVIALNISIFPTEKNNLSAWDILRFLEFFPDDEACVITCFTLSTLFEACDFEGVLTVSLKGLYGQCLYGRDAGSS